MRKMLPGLLVILTVAFAPRVEGQWSHLNNTSDIRAICRVGDTLWVGTNGGLLLYDLLNGEWVAKYIVGPNLSSSSIRAIAGWRDSVLVGTDAGLAVFAGGEVDVQASVRIPELRDLRSIDLGPAGAICLGTYGRGAIVIQGDSIRVVTRADSLLDDRVFAVLRTGDSTYYYATSLGLCAFMDTVWVSFRVGHGLPAGEVRDLLLTEDYAMYALVWNRGLYYFDGVRGRRIPSGGLFADREIAAITLDSDQILWAAGRTGGIYCYRYGQWVSLGESDEDISKARWRCAYADDRGGVYFGSADGLVVSIEEGVIRKLRLAFGLPSNHIRVAVEDSSGTLYFAAGPHFLSLRRGDREFTLEETIGVVIAAAVSSQGELWYSTRWGLFRRTGDRFEEMPLQNCMRASVISSMAFDLSGNLWVGTDRGEVLRFDGSLWIRMGERDELNGGPIDRIVIDDLGRVLALSRHAGLSVFDGRRWESFALEHFGGGPLADAAVDGWGRLFMASADGLWMYRGGDGWRRFEIPLSHGTVRIQAICFDQAGRIYLGTSDGLLLLGGAVSRRIDSAHGLPGTDVRTVLIDGSGLLWVGFLKDGLSLISVEHLW